MKSTAKDQKRNSIGVCQKCAARIYGDVCEESTSTGMLPMHLILYNAAVVLLGGFYYPWPCVPGGNELFFMLTFQVVDAMRQTVTNMIGTLPPQFFAVTVTTVSVVAFLYAKAFEYYAQKWLLKFWGNHFYHCFKLSHGFLILSIKVMFLLILGHHRFHCNAIY